MNESLFEPISKAVISGLAVIGLTTIEVVALLKNYDGALFFSIVAAISGIAGYHIQKLSSLFKSKPLF